MYLKSIRSEWIFQPDIQSFKSCHASSICETSDGTIVAAWFGGTAEGEKDVAIWMARRTVVGWSEPQLLAKDCEEPHWNPVLFESPKGRLFCYYKVGNRIPYWRTYVRESDDKGQTWSLPRELVEGDEGGWGPVRCKMRVLSDGSWLAGASTEQGPWIAYADRSIDEGQTWKRSNALQIQEGDRRGFIQPCFWETEPGSVHMLLRSSEGSIYRSDSSDYGVTWCEAYSTGLPNNNSGLDLVQCSNGMLILCSNPVADNWGARTPLTLQASKDGGKTWQEAGVLENTPGEYSYPAIIEKDGILRVSYTYNRKAIAYREFMIVEDDS